MNVNEGDDMMQKVIIEKQDLSSVSNKIYKIIKAQNPRFRYRVPFFQALGCKLYQIFKM